MLQLYTFNLLKYTGLDEPRASAATLQPLADHFFTDIKLYP